MDELEESVGSALAALFRQQLTLERDATRRLRSLVLKAREEFRSAFGSVAGLASATVMAHAMHLLRYSADRLAVLMGRELRSDTAEMLILGAAAISSDPAGLPSGTLHALDTFHASLLVDVTDDLKNQVAKVIRGGILAGKSVDEIAEAIGLTGLLPTGPFRTAADRAEAIARTELNRVANMAAAHALQAEAVKRPGLMKRWAAQDDARTRPSHSAADGQTVPADADFTVGGEAAAFPCDPRLSPANSVNCRCRLLVAEPQ